MRLIVAVLVGNMLLTSSAFAARANIQSAGNVSDGVPVQRVVLSNTKGEVAAILTYGATLQSLLMPGRDGKLADVVLGHDTVAEYEAKQDYFGATIGRYANRIAHGRFTLDGKSYTLPINDGPNSLHGGGKGFDRVVWSIGKIVDHGPVASVTFSYVSPDGAMGYPGEVTATVTYALSDNGDLTVRYAATTTKPTIINMTSHSYYNLAGDCAPQGAMEQILTLPASRFTPIDATSIPTGELRVVAGTPFDFRMGRTLAQRLRDGNDPQIRIARGYDHNWVLDKGQTAEPEFAARVEDPASGRILEVLSTEPGLQMYTGNFLNGTTIGHNGCVYRMGDGFVLEPQKFPDTPNQPAFGSARLDPGQTYHHTMILRMSIAR